MLKVIIVCDSLLLAGVPTDHTQLFGIVPSITTVCDIHSRHVNCVAMAMGDSHFTPFCTDLASIHKQAEIYKQLQDETGSHFGHLTNDIWCHLEPL